MRARYPHRKLNFGNPTRCAAPGNESAKEEAHRLGIEFDERITYVDLKKKIEAAQAAKPTDDAPDTLA